jgi:hypothetical protein
VWRAVRRRWVRVLRLLSLCRFFEKKFDKEVGERLQTDVQATVLVAVSVASRKHLSLTSLYVSGAFSFSLPLPSDLAGLPVSLVFLRRPLGPPPPPTRCRPAFSRSPSSHERMVANSDNISKRFGSARGVTMNCKRMFVTRRLWK